MKTGNDANNAAVRLARAYTGRPHLLTCGYHGYSDWFAAGTGAPPMLPREGNGVPAALDAYVTNIAYGDADALERAFTQHGAQIAALIMVPYDWGEDVAHAFIHRARTLTAQHGSLLIFDQVLTGFRLALAGAQEFFGVIPDLTTYAKALANGFPLSAFGGRREVMQALDRAVITTTYAGEALSLAAAGATLDVLEREPVVDHLWQMGRRLREGFEAAATAVGLQAHAYGLPPAVQFRFSSEPEADLRAHQHFFRALFREGIFPSRPFLLSYAHKAEDIDETVEAMRRALEAVQNAVA
jgi:glutamate-1-semialdehyde aminotransferase